jgi:hypothetical protein
MDWKSNIIQWESEEERERTRKLSKKNEKREKIVGDHGQRRSRFSPQETVYTAR